MPPGPSISGKKTDTLYTPTHVCKRRNVNELEDHTMFIEKVIKKQ